MFSHEKTLCFAPLVLILRALDADMTDKDFADKLIGNEESLYYKGCVLNMLRQMHDDGVHSMDEARKMLGASFRSKFRRLPTWYTDEEIALFLLR
jgi:DNA-directed RNA polymerase I subunit RPA2